MLFELTLCLALIGVPDTPEMNLAKAKSLTFTGYYEESDKLLKGKVKQDNTYHLCSMINAFQQNNKAVAEQHLKALEDSFEPLPRRYQAMIYIIRNDIDQWKKGELDDIARDMKHSSNRLNVAQGGDKTQAVQKEIVRKLEQKIKELEDKAAGGSGADSKDKDKEAAKYGKSQGGQDQQPAPDSTIMGGGGAGKIDEKQLRKIAENWGTLPPAARAKVVQDITRDLPPKFRPLIEDYFKALEKRK